MNKYTLVLAMACCLFASSSRAATEDPADVTSANLVNLNYYLRPGKLRAIAEGEWALHDDTSQGSSTSYGDYGLLVEYGLPIDGLRISAREGYDTETDTNNGTAFRYTGITDPNFYLNYRILDAKGDGLSLDAELIYSPSLGTAQFASSSQTGNQYRGYSELGFSAGAFYRTAWNEAELSGTVLKHFGRNASYLGTNTTQTGTGYTEVDFSLTDRVHVSSRFFLEPLLSFNFGTTHNYSYSDGSTASYSYPFYLRPEFDAGYLAKPNLLFTAYIGYNAYTYTATASFNIPSPVSVDSVYVGAHVVYEF